MTGPLDAATARVVSSTIGRGSLETVGGLLKPSVAAAVDHRGFLVQNDLAVVRGRRRAIDQLHHVIDRESVEAGHDRCR